MKNNNNNVELAFNSIVRETEPEEMEKRLAELRAEAAKLMKGRLDSIVRETEPEEMEKRLAELRAEAAKLMKGRLDDRKIDRIIEICAEIRKIRGEE